MKTKTADSTIVDVPAILTRVSNALKITGDLELAKLFRVKPVTISSWRARNSMPLELIVELARTRGISLEEIILGKEQAHHHVPKIVYFPVATEAPRYLDAMNERVSFAICSNPWLFQKEDLAKMEILLVTDDEYISPNEGRMSINYGDQVVLRRLHVTDPITERGY